MSSAAWPVQVALVDALNADAGFTAVLGGAQRVYSGKAPSVTGDRYVVVGDTAEGRVGTFGRKGSRGEILLHVWTRTVNNRDPLLVYTEMERVLDGVALPVAGHEMVTGHLELVTIFPDEDLARMHLVARYIPVTFTGEA